MADGEPSQPHAVQSAQLRLRAFVAHASRDDVLALVRGLVESKSKIRALEAKCAALDAANRALAGQTAALATDALGAIEDARVLRHRVAAQSAMLVQLGVPADDPRVAPPPARATPAAATLPLPLPALCAAPLRAPLGKRPREAVESDDAPYDGVDDLDDIEDRFQPPPAKRARALEPAVRA